MFLALLGGAFGLVLALWALPVLLSLAPAEIGEFGRIGLDSEVLGFSLIVSIFTGTLLVSHPLFSARGHSNESLREGERGSSLGRSPARSSLIAAEIALSLVLLVGAGLMMKSFVRLTRIDPGFNPERLLIFNVGFLLGGRRAPDQLLSGSGGTSQISPGSGVGRRRESFAARGRNSSREFNIPGSSQTYNADIRVSTPDYFRTMAIPLMKGRNFSAHDTAASLPVAMINEATAANVFPDKVRSANT